VSDAPALLLVVALAAASSVPIEAVLRDHVGADALRPAGDAGFIICADAGASSVRDWLARGGLRQDAFVVEFERWSALGDGVDAAWLLRRGH